MRHFRHDVKPAFRYMGLHSTHPEISGAACGKNIAQCERTEIEREIRRDIRKIHPVVKPKIRPPIHINIIGCIQKSRFRIGSHEDEFFLHGADRSSNPVDAGART